MHRVIAATIAALTLALGLTFTAISPAHGWPVGAHWRVVGMLLSLLAATFVWIACRYPARLREDVERATSALDAHVQDRTRELAETNRTLESEIARRREAEEAYRSVNRALRVVGEANHVLLRATDESRFLHDICRIITDVGGYRMGWVGFAENNPQKSVRPQAQAGFEEGYLERASITWSDASERGRGPTGTAIRTGRPSINKWDDPSFAPWRDEATKRGFLSNCALPLIWDGRVFGVLGIYAAEAHAFDDEEVGLLMRMADNIAYGIHALRAQNERAQLQEELRQAQKLEAIGRLAGGIAHDFNNILTVIAGRAETLLDELTPSHRLHHDARLIHETADRATALTSQLLAFSRKQILKPKVLDLNAHVAAMITMLRRLIGEDIELEFVPAEPLGSIEVDPAQLEQVIVNLALNARDAMPTGGKLTLETADIDIATSGGRNPAGLKPGRYVMLAVADTGIGMDPSVVSRIFEPFFTTKSPGKGTGLGLATVHGIIKQSGGDIWVRSDPGRGTAFRIYLPRVDRVPDEPRERSVRVAAPAGHETILLVEDQVEVAALAEEFLILAGYRVMTAHHPEEALRIVREYPGPIDLLLTDVIMPQMNGERLQQAVVALRPGIAVLYMSGYTDDALAERGILSPGIHLLQKPFTRDNLVAKAREVLVTRAAQGQPRTTSGA